MRYTDAPNRIKTRSGEISDYAKDTEAIRNSINNILMTKRGSLPGNPEFGSKLQEVLFNQITPLLIEFIKADIRMSLQRWEPRVRIQDIIVKDNTDYNALMISIVYTIVNDVKTNSITEIFKVPYL
jgi:phage baseplate assembly protein W